MNSFQEINAYINQIQEELQQAKDSAKPCPFCGKTNLSFVYDTNAGHVESIFFNARIKCNNCSCSKGNGIGYGYPGIQGEIDAYKKWNERIN